MRRTLRALLIVGVVAASSTLLQVLPAAAHGIGDEHGPPPPSFGEYLLLGIQHMLTGYDHLLFVAGIVLLVSRFKSVVKYVTTFTIGHSLTLLGASLAGWTVSPLLIDTLIAVSVAYIGAEIVWGDKWFRREDGLRIAALDPKVIVFLFGLLHGLGLATRLQALGLPQEGLVRNIVGFNVGVELGQIAALIAFVGVASVLPVVVKNFSRLRSRIGVGLVAAGLAIAALLNVTATI